MLKYMGGNKKKIIAKSLVERHLVYALFRLVMQTVYTGSIKLPSPFLQDIQNQVSFTLLDKSTLYRVMS